MAARRKSRERVAWAIAAVAVISAAALGTLLWQSGNEPPGLIRSAIVMPGGTELLTGEGLAISPDGTLVVFIARGKDQVRRLWLRRLDATAAQPLLGTEKATHPFWSPDSRHVGFAAEGTLKRIDARGGPARTICDVSGPFRGGSWSSDGTIVFSRNNDLQRVSASGGAPERLSQPPLEHMERHRYPSFLPDGQHVLFLAQTDDGGAPDDQSTIEVLSLEDGRRTRLLVANSPAQYASGHLLFWREGSVLAQQFDSGTLRLIGDPFPIAERVAYTGTEYAVFSASRDGTLVLRHGEGIRSTTRMVWYDRAGEPSEPVGPPRRIASFQLSSDETRVAYDEAGDVWVQDLVRGSTMRLSFDSSADFHPIWSADDEWLLWTRQRNGRSSLVRKRASGLGEEEVVYESKSPEVDLYADSWSRDGRTIIFVAKSPQTLWDIWSLTLDDLSSRVLVDTPYVDASARLSPDGNWLAYMSVESGQPEVYLRKLTD